MNASSRFPFTPYPDGWYVVALSDELRPGGMLARQYLGREMVIYRTASGRALVADAYCPHLGAHLGHGGSVTGERLVCPFHRFEFDVDGRCARIPYGKKIPPLARLATWPVREQNGLVFVHHDANGREPAWEVPELEDGPWFRVGSDRLRVRTHPQETTENSVDAGHLAELHGYESCDIVRPLQIEGPRLNISYCMTRRTRFFGAAVVPVSSEFHVEVRGLGHSLVYVDVESVGLRLRLRVLSTPIDGEYLDLRTVFDVDRESSPRGLAAPLRLLPSALWLRLLGPAFFRPVKHDVRQDQRIWENKIYTEPPALAEGDGPVGAYRRWCRQFYPEVRAGHGDARALATGGSTRS